MFSVGAYNLASAIVIDRDWVTLRSEGKSHWPEVQRAFTPLPVRQAGAKLLQER